VVHAGDFKEGLEVVSVRYGQVLAIIIVVVSGVGTNLPFQAARIEGRPARGGILLGAEYVQTG
jgi:hypothetical protein